MSNVRTPEECWYGWHYYHPVESEDPKAAYVAGYRRSRDEQLATSSVWPKLMTQLKALHQEMAAYFEDVDTDDGLEHGPDYQSGYANGRRDMFKASAEWSGLVLELQLIYDEMRSFHLEHEIEALDIRGPRN